MSRSFSLNTLKAGISRLKTKGSPDPQTLYDLVNGYVTPSGTVDSRPGCPSDARLPEGQTRGLMSYRGLKYVFSDHYVDMSALPEYRCAILTRPLVMHEGDDPPPQPTLAAIHFAEPFLGYPYVVAEWSDGAIFHYWLQGEGEALQIWQADTTYRFRAIVHPSTPNGFSYEANRIGEPGPAWAPNVERALDDVIEPTVQNGFEYVCIEAFGNPPRSGSVEPTWPTEEGAIVVEEADLTPPSTPVVTPPPTLPPDVDDRYGGGGGGFNTDHSMQVQ